MDRKQQDGFSGMNRKDMKTEKRRRKKRSTGYRAAGVLLGAALFLGTIGGGTVTQAEEYWPQPSDVTSEAACVIDITSGTILYEKNADEQHYPASITKILTALVAAENSDMSDTVTFSADDVFINDSESSSIARDLGEQMTMEQCMYGMILASANECAYAIAEHVGNGSIDKFIDMMNQKAKELGCTNSHFVNPNGLPDPDHYTSAHDMALIAAAAYKNPIVAKIVGTKQYTIPPTNKHTDPTPLNNHHQMLNSSKTAKWLYDYCLGGKTGYTSLANHTLVTYAKKDNLLLACVVMNTDADSQYRDTINLFNFCFENFTEYSLKDSIDLQKENQTGTLGKDIRLLKVSDGGVVVPKTVELSDVQSKISTRGKKSGKTAGTIEYTYAGHKVGQADLLYAEKNVDVYPFHNVSKKEGGSSVSYIRIDYKMILGIIAAAGAVIFFIFYFRRKYKKYRQRHPKKARVYVRDFSRYKKIRKNDRKHR